MTEYKEDNIPDNIDGVDVIQEQFMACEALSHGQEVVRFEFGDSMFPILKSGQFCKLTPIKEGDEINVGDCVFSLIDGTPNTHMVWVKHQTEEGTWYCIATTKGNVIGWTRDILAKAHGIQHIVTESSRNKRTFKSVFDYGISAPAISDLNISLRDVAYRENTTAPIRSVDDIMENTDERSRTRTRRR